MRSIFRSGKKKKSKKGIVFYERENLFQTVGDLIKTLDIIDDSNCLLAQNPIEFHGNKLDNINEKTISSDFGEKAFLLMPETVVEGSKIYYFRLSSEHLKFLIQVHFLDGYFYFASTKVYGDSLLSERDKKKVIKRIVKKYIPESDDYEFEFKIRDEQGNILFTKDDVFFHINYLPNNKITQKLREKHSDYKPPKPGQNLKNTLDELI